MSPSKLALVVTPANIALLLLFASASFNFLARYFYLYYRLLFGTLYPSYSSYKAIKNKDLKEYTRWLMYWVCFGIFSFAEFFTDIIFSFWFPFYYELKILFILWLMSPYGNGAKILYKCLIHPELTRREAVIDSYISRATEYGFTLLLQLWSKASDYLNHSLTLSLSMLYSVLTNHLQSRSYDTVDYLSKKPSKDMTDNQVNDEPLEPFLEENETYTNHDVPKRLLEEDSLLDETFKSDSLENMKEKEENMDEDDPEYKPQNSNSEEEVVVKKTRKKGKRNTESGKNAQRPKRTAAMKARFRFHQDDEETED